MKTRWLEHQQKYDGSQLKSLFAYMNYEVKGDSIVAWQGPCDVPIDKMVDGEDKLAKAKICGDNMVHFIVEMFNTSLQGAVALQRLLASLACDWLRVHSSQRDLSEKLRRDGDDLFVANRKLSISIATISPTSALIHFAVNITNDGTPVPTLALQELGVSSRDFAEALMINFQREFLNITEATQKVFWVK